MLEYILDGGSMMYPLLACSIVGLAVILDRMRAFRLAEGDTSALREEVLRALAEKDFARAEKACAQRRGPVAAVLLVGINKYRRLVELGKSETEIEVSVNKSMEDYAPHVMEALERRLNLLILVASIAPLLGMTGTVTGMIRSFNSMAGASGLEGGAVAAGISEALITTAAGLLIAIPCVVFYNFYSKRVDRFVLAIEESAAELIDFITLGKR
jgi:biopolymer transport protein ExbB